jgi:AcrR family transcriptional regulator
MVARHARTHVETAPAASTVDEAESDFRVRVAREKRERMRSRLLNAIMKIGSERKGRGPTVIDEVIQEAGVSRGTFYKYFETLEEALSALGRTLTDDMVLTLSHMFSDVEDPAFRISSASQFMMVRAALDPAWGGFVSHTAHLSEDSFLVDAMRLNCETGKAQGLFTYASVEAAIDFHMGLIMQSMRRMPQIGIDEDYIRDVAAIALIGLGVERSTAQKIAVEAGADLARRAPQFLTWWDAARIESISSKTKSQRSAKGAKRRPR